MQLRISHSVRGSLQQLAGSSVAKRQKIFDTFAALQEALVKAAHPEQARFRNNVAVMDSSESLYQTVVDSIEDLFHLLAANGRSSCTSLAQSGEFDPQLISNRDQVQRASTAFEAVSAHDYG